MIAIVNRPRRRHRPVPRPLVISAQIDPTQLPSSQHRLTGTLPCTYMYCMKE